MPPTDRDPLEALADAILRRVAADRPEGLADGDGADRESGPRPAEGPGEREESC
jgi:hypothetical protein